MSFTLADLASVPVANTTTSGRGAASYWPTITVGKPSLLDCSSVVGAKCEEALRRAERR